MRLDAYLTTAQILDCHGRVTHTFTVLPDGTVRVTWAGPQAVVDPRTRRVLTPHAHLAPEIIGHACALALDAGR